MRFFQRIQQSIKKSSLLKDSVWSLLGSVVSKGLALLAGIIVARWLGKDVYGEYGLIKNTLMYMAVFSTFGLGYSNTRYIAVFSQNDDIASLKSIVRFSTTVTSILSSAICIAVLFFSENIASFLGRPELASSLRIFSVAVVFNAINTCQTGVLSGLKAFDSIAKNNTLVGVITFSLTIVLVYYWGLDGALSALLLSFVISCIINRISIVKRINRIDDKHSCINEDSLNKFDVLRTSFPIAIEESMFSIMQWVTNLLIVKLASYGELGIYNAASQWSSVVFFVPVILRNVTLSHLSSSLSSDTEHERVLKTMMKVNFIATFIPFIIISALSHFIARVYGSGFEGLPIVLNISVFYTIFSCMSNVYVQNLISNKQTWTLLLFRFLRESLNILLAYLFVSRFKSCAALCLAGTTAFMHVLYFITLHLHYRINNRWKERS